MLTRWDPFTEMNRLSDAVFRHAPPSGFTPPVDIREEEDAITLAAELPGLKVEDVHIDVENNVLTLRGERKREEKQEQNGWLRVERTHGSFTRSFVLPRTVDAAAIEAELVDGVLSLRLPKKAAALPRSIEIKTS